MTLTPEQIAERRSGLGGSDALAYCGKDPRKTPLELYLEKTDLAQPEPPPEKNNMRMEWGSRLEPVVRDWMAEELGRRIHTSQRLYRSVELPMMIGHPDGITESPMEGVEIKTADKYMAAEFGDIDTDQVPLRYILQVTHYMVVTRLRRFHLAALVGGNDCRHYVIDFDPELADMLVKRARAFWQHVETKNPPPPVTLEDAARRWPQSRGRNVMANDQVIQLVGELRAARKAEEDATAKADTLETAIKTYMGDADGLENGRHRVIATWRSQSRERFDQKTFSEAHPDLFAQYRAKSEFRVFRLR